MGDINFVSLYPRLFRVFSQKEAVVADFLFNSTNELSWNLLFTRELFDWEAQIVTSLLDSLHDVFLSRLAMDKRIWILESSRKFSSKSFFNVLSNSHILVVPFPHWMVLKPAVPPRVKAFS